MTLALLLILPLLLLQDSMFLFQNVGKREPPFSLAMAACRCRVAMQ